MDVLAKKCQIYSLKLPPLHPNFWYWKYLKYKNLLWLTKDGYKLVDTLPIETWVSFSFLGIWARISSIERANGNRNWQKLPCTKLLRGLDIFGMVSWSPEPPCKINNPDRETVWRDLGTAWRGRGFQLNPVIYSSHQGSIHVLDSLELAENHRVTPGNAT